MNDVIINNTITSIIAIAGWIFAMYQFNKQHIKNINLQEENLKKELQINVAEESIKLLSQIRADLIKLNAFIDGFKFEMIGIKNSGFFSEKWKNPVNNLRECFNNYNDSTLNFLYYFESREVILNKFLNMKNTFNNKYSETSKLSNDLIRFLIDSFIVDLPLKKQIEKMDHEKYELLTESLREHIFDLFGYIHDFNIELQNAFLAEMFNYKIPQRAPEKTNVKVLSIDK